MDRLSIDVTSQEKQAIKALAALSGQSIKDYVLERVLPENSENQDISALLLKALQEDSYSDWSPEKIDKIKENLNN